MDWKYKHFNQEAVFQAPRQTVLEVARAFVAESIRWQITDTADGFEARGYSFAHQATAKFRIEPAADGTRVAVELLVERASSLGFMLFDVGGYYNHQICKWLAGIQWSLHQRLTSASGAESPPQNKPAILQDNKIASHIFSGCFLIIAVIFALYFLSILIFAIVGLATGHLYLVGRGDPLVVHGGWARAISGIILAIVVFIGLRIRRGTRPRKDPIVT
jgi:hypothetical protein